jgi:hypothetical protein
MVAMAVRTDAMARVVGMRGAAVVIDHQDDGLGRFAFSPTTHGVDGGNKYEQGQERRHERRQNPSPDRVESHAAF